MRKKGTQEVFAKLVIVCMREQDKSEWIQSCQRSEVKVGMHQGYVLSPFLLAVVVDVVTEFVREGALSELLCVDDLFLMSETTEGLGNNFLK